MTRMFSMHFRTFRLWTPVLMALFALPALAQMAKLPAAPPGSAVATFAGGCFWCMEQPFDKIDGVLATMARERIGSALVTRRGKLVGVFTTSDACQLMADWLRACFPESGGDEVA